MYALISSTNLLFSAVVKLDLLPSHLNECEHNPKKPVHCEKGCGMTIPKDEVKVSTICLQNKYLLGFNSSNKI